MAAGEAPEVPAQGAPRLRLGRRLGRRFYARRAWEVAPELLGKVIVRRLDDGTRLAARIVETEAYEPEDPASHSFRGRTPRNEVMFGDAGHLYVYFTYGMHFCMNVVTGRAGEGSAVLLRAAEPLDGVDAMRVLRGREHISELCAGPARLCQAFGVDRALDGTDLVGGRHLWIAEGEPVSASRIAVGPRVGIRVGLEYPWRFSVAGDPFVSSLARRPRAVTRSGRTGPSTR
jgi:DNA-3-methyladenine glycosylase